MMPDIVHEIAPERLATLFAALFVSAAIVGVLILKPILRLFFGRA
jgi:hypothetical protein